FLHTTEVPIPPRRLNPQIPPNVEHALLRALSKQRTERYPSISAFVAALNTIDNSPLGLPLAQGHPSSPSSFLPPSEASYPNTPPPPYPPNPTLPPPPIPSMQPQPSYPPLAGNEVPYTNRNLFAGETYPPPPTYPAGQGPAWYPTPHRPPANIKRQPIIAVAL